MAIGSERGSRPFCGGVRVGRIHYAELKPRGIFRHQALCGCKPPPSRAPLQPMRRLSVFARKPPAEKPVTLDTEVAKAPTNLSHFLHLQKVNYLKAVEQGQSRQWTMVMGNESGGMLDNFAFPQ